MIGNARIISSQGVKFIRRLLPDISLEQVGDNNLLTFPATEYKRDDRESVTLRCLLLYCVVYLLAEVTFIDKFWCNEEHGTQEF